MDKNKQVQKSLKSAESGETTRSTLPLQPGLCGIRSPV